jgi:hypothetical protein
MQNGNGQSVQSQLPYFREYVEQILKPRIGKIIEEVRAGLTDQVWAEVIQRMASEQGGKIDAASMESTRVLLEQGLKLRMSTHVVADFAAAAAPAQAPQPVPVAAEPQDTIEVVEGGFPNNPLARAVGGVRRVTR